jgi:hypothetical protein
MQITPVRVLGWVMTGLRGEGGPAFRQQPAILRHSLFDCFEERQSPGKQFSLMDCSAS